MKRIVMIATIVWMAVIWSFSAKPADASTNTSHMAGKIIVSLAVPDFESWPEEKQQQLIGRIDHPVRKAAHAAEYAVLGILLFVLFTCHMKHRQLLAAWGFGTLYAVSDEIHQYFVPGRSCQISDMALDSAGVLAGIVIACMIIRISGKRG